jgi:hypothetical protein
MNKENSAPARLFPLDEENPAGPPASSGSPSTWEHKFYGHFGQQVEFPAQPSGEEEVECESYIVDNSKMQYVSAQCHIMTAGASGAEIVCKYSPTLSLGDMAPFVVMPLNTANAVVPRVTTPIAVPNDSKVKRLLLKLYRRGGNGTLSPAMWNFIVSAASGRPPTIPTGSDDPLPEGDWGLIIHDLNATSLEGTYDEDDEVGSWNDDSGGGRHGTAGTGAPPGPIFKPYGINGVRPCVRWPGGNTNAISHLNPTQHHFTAYVVAQNLSAGYAFTIQNGYDGYPFGKLLQIIGGVLGNGFALSVNDSVGSPTIIFETRTLAQLLELHLYRFVFNRFSGNFWLFIDGVMVAIGTCSPQITATTNILIGQYNTLAGTMDLGRLVTYDTPHVTPDMSSITVSADGLTEPELVLQAYWGTP